MILNVYSFKAVPSLPGSAEDRGYPKDTMVGMSTVLTKQWMSLKRFRTQNLSGY